MGILAEADRRILERIGYGNGRRGERVVRCLENCRRRGGGERSPEMPAGSVDLEAALWMARGCQAVGRYDDHVLAAAWLERAKPGEESGDPAARETAGSAASGGFQGSADPAEEGRAARGEWHWRMALASMYCGDPEEALEEAKKGVEFAPDSPMAWRIFAELSAGLGDRQAALEAVRRGRASLEGASSGEEDAAFGYPLDDWGELEEMILSGAGLEELERARLLHMGQKNGESGSRLERLRLEAARGITEDEAGLLRVKEVLQPEIWDTDTAYCGFCCNFEGRELEGAFYMNEAAVSKWTPEEMREILKMLPKIHRQARAMAAAEEDDWGLLELYGDPAGVWPLRPMRGRGGCWCPRGESSPWSQRRCRRSGRFPCPGGTGVFRRSWSSWRGIGGSPRRRPGPGSDLADASPLRRAAYPGRWKFSAADF